MYIITIISLGIQNSVLFFSLIVYISTIIGYNTIMYQLKQESGNQFAST